MLGCGFLATQYARGNACVLSFIPTSLTQYLLFLGVYMVCWLYLVIGIVFEVAGTMAMKFSEGLTKVVPSVLMFLCYAICFVFITLALKKIELSVAYTIWAGVGTTIIALIGIFYFGEQATAIKLASIGLVIAGVVGLKFSAS